jgi:hypothetical protein
VGFDDEQDAVADLAGLGDGADSRASWRMRST